MVCYVAAMFLWLLGVTPDSNRMEGMVLSNCQGFLFLLQGVVTGFLEEWPRMSSLVE